MSSKNKKSGYESTILIVQLGAVLIVLAAVLIIKFINKDWFYLLRGFYLGNFSADTSVNEVLDDDFPAQNSLKVITASAVSVSKSEKIVNPLDAVQITSPYGYRKSPINGEKEFHKGIDLAGNTGENVYAVSSGKVVLSQYSNTYGYYIIIEHSKDVKTLYAHCEKLLKKEGETVLAGEVIALLGSTGVSTAPHLHFELIVSDNNTNPMWLIKQ